MDPTMDSLPFSSFTVDQDCVIYTTKTMDRDEGQEAYSIKILASDEGEYPESCTATATLIVNVKDLNDNAPEPYLTNLVCIPECDESEIRVATIYARDKDKDPNGGPFSIEFPDVEDNSAMQRINEIFTLKWDKDGDGCEDKSGAGILTKKAGVSFDREN
jgi:hypothetical protein